MSDRQIIRIIGIDIPHIPDDVKGEGESIGTICQSICDEEKGHWIICGMEILHI